jgi:hypothetical protein
VSLPNDDVLCLLRDCFVLGARNIERDQHVGVSHGYKCNQTAVGTTNGAGGRNVQLLVLATDTTIVHALPGFWHPQELAAELRLALDLHRLHHDDRRSPSARLAMFRALHESAARDEATTRDGWQSFDRSTELMRASEQPRDTVLCDAAGKPALGTNGQMQLKPIRRLVHDRLLAQPFPRLAEFDLEAFVDYGRAYYDNNAWVDDGRRFTRAERANQQREKQRAKAAKAALAASKRRK